MSKLWAAIRRLLGRKEDGDKKEPNDVQKVVNRLHPYDEVEIAPDGSGVAVNDSNREPNDVPEVQTNNRAPRPYDEVGPPDGDGKVNIVP